MCTFYVSFLCDSEYFAILTRQCLAECLTLANFTSSWIQFYLIEIIYKISVSVWIAESKVNCIVIVLKFVAELQSVIWIASITAILLDVIAKIWNTLTSSVPTSSIATIFVRALCHFFWIYTDFHSKIEKWIRLSEIIDIELNCHSFRCIFDLKEKPLCMTIRVDVILHE